jgi:hypothetical protein
MRPLADMLKDLQYAPQHDVLETKRLRAQNAGNPAMQQTLAVEDRYHQGKGMMQDSPIAALAALFGSIPYDAAKAAYFNGPRPVKQALGSLSERLFPGEGFNDQTTSRPDINQYRGMISGMLDAWKK